MKKKKKPSEVRYFSVSGFSFSLIFSASKHFSLSLSLSLSLSSSHREQWGTTNTAQRLVDFSMWRRGGFGVWVCVCVLEWISGWVLGCVSISVWVSAFVFVFRRDFWLGFGFCLHFRFVFGHGFRPLSAFRAGCSQFVGFNPGCLYFCFFSNLVFYSFLFIFPICLFF